MDWPTSVAGPCPDCGCPMVIGTVEVTLSKSGVPGALVPVHCEVCGSGVIHARPVRGHNGQPVVIP